MHEGSRIRAEVSVIPAKFTVVTCRRSARGSLPDIPNRRPAARYFHKGWIDETQRDAGEIFRDVWEAAQIGIRAINWDTVYGVSAKEDLKPAQAEAMHEWRRILRHTNKVGRAILIAVCGEGCAVKDFERQASWRDRYGIERLREALDDVAECQRLITRRLRP